MACSTVSDSLTPPAHDWMPVFMSARKPFRSVARCDRDGCTAMPTRTASTAAPNPAANSQRGVFLVAHRPGRMGTYGGPVVGGVCTVPSARPLRHQRGAAGQFGRGKLAEDPLDDVV